MLMPVCSNYAIDSIADIRLKISNFIYILVYNQLIGILDINSRIETSYLSQETAGPAFSMH